MNKTLPPRPNLDHLRRQAKALLAALASGDPEAIATFRDHLPAAKGLSEAKIRAGGWRLADAQSAIARKSGFEAWPRLARHVEQLRALEGTWTFARLEVDGQTIPPEAVSASRLLIDGDRFRMESPEATYEGVFNIDVEAQPHHIDIEFVSGPEAGNLNRGIFRLDGDQLELCLDMRGRARPQEFRTAPNSGHACETLRRASVARPPAVTGGTPPGTDPAPGEIERADPAAFAFVDSPTLARLQGTWSAEVIVRDGTELPWLMRKTAKRVAKLNEVTITVMGSTIIHALVRIDETASPVRVDYCNIGGQAKGTLQHGIMEWRGEDAAFCMSAPGQDRPSDFECAAGSGRSLSVWKPKK